MQAYRVWIVNRGGWLPTTWSAMPPEHSTVVGLQEDTDYTYGEAMVCVEAFNQRMMHDRSRNEWAVMVPVEVVYHGDLVAGEQMRRRSIVTCVVTPPRRRPIGDVVETALERAHTH